MNTLLVIFMGIIVLVILMLILFSKYDLWKTIFPKKAKEERILMEDVLKFIYDCEYKNSNCIRSMICENTHETSGAIIHIIDVLRGLSLINVQDKLITLTDNGRVYALRIIRVHRIWERYLADETGINEMDWHAHADKIEHSLSFKEANQLAASIGNPVFDPHGDPIPSQEGLIPSHKGKSLNLFKAGQIVKILHVEDEPHTVYAQLVALGIHAHMVLKVIDNKNDKIVFLTSSTELVLTHVFAENITVVEYNEVPIFDESNIRLTELKIGESAKIMAISPNCRGQQRRRLMDLGIIPGSNIKNLMKSPSGEPVAYQVMGATIAFRKEQAEKIFIKLIS